MAPVRGEIWLCDCGMAEKVRPVLILSVPFAETDRAVITVVFLIAPFFGVIRRSDSYPVKKFAKKCLTGLKE